MTKKKSSLKNKEQKSKKQLSKNSSVKRKKAKLAKQTSPQEIALQRVAKSVMNDFPDFSDYIWQHYGPKGFHSQFFDKNLTRMEVGIAMFLYLSAPKSIFGGGDTLDREIVRDIMFKLRGRKKTEHNVTPYLVGF